MPRSLQARRTALRRSSFGSVLPKRLSISRQRVEKSLSLAEAQDRMQVIRQYHECVDVEAVGLLYRSRKSAI